MAENEVAALDQKIQDEIREKAEKAQKEYFLKEQLKIIRRELGEEQDPRTMELQRPKVAKHFFESPFVVPGRDGATKVEPDAVFRTDGRWIVCDVKTNQYSVEMVRKAVDPVTDPVDTMRSDALDSYRKRLAETDDAQDLAARRKTLVSKMSGLSLRRKQRK